MHIFDFNEKKLIVNIDEKIYNQINQIGIKYKTISKIILFGSRARGDHAERSDIDLAIYLTDLSENNKIIFDIQNISTLLKIDIVIMNDKINPKFINNINHEGIILYEQI